MESKNDINAEKSVKKIWAKPQIILLDTNTVTSGAHSGHYEKNFSLPTGFFGSFSLHTPSGGRTYKPHTKNYYIS